MTGLNLVLQQPSTVALAKTKADIREKELLLLLVSLPWSAQSGVLQQPKMVSMSFAYWAHAIVCSRTVYSRSSFERSRKGRKRAEGSFFN